MLKTPQQGVIVARIDVSFAALNHEWPLSGGHLPADNSHLCTWGRINIGRGQLPRRLIPTRFQRSQSLGRYGGAPGSQELNQVIGQLSQLGCTHHQGGTAQAQC